MRVRVFEMCDTRVVGPCELDLLKVGLAPHHRALKVVVISHIDRHRHVAVGSPTHLGGMCRGGTYGWHPGCSCQG